MRVRIGKACRWLLVSPLLVCSVALGVVFATPQQAQALDASTVLKVGTTTAAPRTLATGAGTLAGLCLANPAVCAGLVGLAGTAFVVAALYGDDVTSIPILGDIFSQAGKWLGLGASGCAVSFDPEIVGGHLTFYYSWGGCGSRAGSDRAVTERLICKVGTVYSVQAVGSPTLVGGTTGTSGSATHIPSGLCNSPAEVVYWRGYLQLGGGGGTPGRSATVSVGTEVPEDQITTTTTVRCDKPDGGIGTTVLSYTGLLSQIGIPSCEAEFPGSTPKDITVTRGPTGAQEQIYTNTLTNPRDNYPDCFGSAGEYLNTCRVRVWINGEPCVVGMAGCNDPKQYVQDNPGAEWECRWGPYVIAKADCAHLKNRYSTHTGAEVRVDPVTGTPTVDPEVPTNPPNPPNPPPGCQVDCVTPPIPPDDPENPNGGEGCLAEAFSLNPVDWVYVPVRCVLTWAFVPPEGTWDAATDRVAGALEGDSMDQWRTAVAGTFDGVSGGSSGCQGPGFAVPDFLQDAGFPSPWYPVSSCSSTAANLAQWSHTLSTVGLVVLAVVKVVELVTSGLGLSTHIGIIRGNAWEDNVRGERFR